MTVLHAWPQMTSEIIEALTYLSLIMNSYDEMGSLEIDSQSALLSSGSSERSGSLCKYTKDGISGGNRHLPNLFSKMMPREPSLQQRMLPEIGTNYLLNFL